VAAQEVLQHEPVVERAGARRCKVQDALPGRALHDGVEIGEVQRHGMRRAEDHPIEVRLLRGGDLEQGIALAGGVDQRLRCIEEPRVDGEPDGDED
jgi:hypothetical protein